ncbi:hypothetical protein QTN47_23365 [Danxiaibacter flavus]|uniref:Uncharacterized protein n=1 Tax=Danxiaibacter flavus TaxID=3049108 RepID=A0ABV3ZKQ6_9BACT|nr:hypothetical protein QNM32_23370 [Chitinophagaceae bacterium DXS]
MKNSNKEILENTMDGTPVQFLHGTDSISIILQSQLSGLHIGDKKTVYLEKAHSAADDDYTFEVFIEHIRPALTEEVILGYPFPSNGDDCDEHCSCYNAPNTIG